MKYVQFQPILALFMLVFIAQWSLEAQEKYALVIGNGAYTTVGKLNNPVNDANDMAAALEGLGFKVDKVLNGDLSAMENAVVRLKNQLNKNTGAYGFFFYAGHGVQSAGENYLIPVNADIKSENFLRRQALHVQEVLDELNDAGNALNIVILDACRDNPFSWGRSTSRGLQVVSAQPADSIIVYATSAGKTASDGTGRNGLFTTHLLKNLKTPGLEVKDIFWRTGEDVSQATNKTQIPEVAVKFFKTAYLSGVPPFPAPVPQPSPQPDPQNMVRIHGGTFLMGSPASEVGRDSDEGPQHQVRVSGFWMGKYEVTQKEYQEVMGKNPSYFKGDNLPVENVSWYDAVEYCNARSIKEGLTPAYRIDKSRKDPNNQNSNDSIKWVVSWDRNANGYRLPTEAEWEYACRAGTTTRYWSGNEEESLAGKANVADLTAKEKYKDWTVVNIRDGYAETAPVGSFAPNPWGLYDMHGNVWEWCWDWYGAYTADSATDPSGASSGSDRGYHGGSWYYFGWYLRSADRGSSTPSLRYYNLGFRVLRP